MPDQTTRRPRRSATTDVSAADPPTPVLSGPADVVAAVPYLLGHEPADCLVAIGMRPGGRLGVVARIDVAPALRALEPAVVVAGRVIGALVTDADEAAILLTYDGTDPSRGPGDAATAVLAAVRAGLDDAGITVADVLQVGPQRWRSLLCEDPWCCPADGSSVEATRSRPVAVGFVLDGRSPLADRDALEPESPRASPAARRAAGTAATRWRRGGGTGENLAGRRLLLQEWVSLVDDHHRNGRAPAPGRSGRLAAGWADDARLRDACMVAVLPGGQLLPDALVAGVSADLQPVLADPSCAGAVFGVAPVLRIMAGCVGGRELAAVLALHAWLSWASGCGGAAGDLASRALAAEPGHRLAELVRQLLERALAPDWARPSDAVRHSGVSVAGER